LIYDADAVKALFETERDEIRQAYFEEVDGEEDILTLHSCKDNWSILLWCDWNDDREAESDYRWDDILRLVDIQKTTGPT